MDFDTLCKQLQKNDPRLTKLDLDDYKTVYQSIRLRDRLVKALLSNHTIQELYVNDCYAMLDPKVLLRESNFFAFFEMLVPAQLPLRLLHCQCHCPPMTATGLSRFLADSQSCRNLQHLHYREIVPPTGGEVERYNSTQSLVPVFRALVGAQNSNASLSATAAATASNSQQQLVQQDGISNQQHQMHDLSYLDLGSDLSTVDQSVCLLLADLVRQSRKLRTLYLRFSACEQGVDFRPLVDAIGRHPTLQVVSLNPFRTDFDFEHELTRLLQQHTENDDDDESMTMDNDNGMNIDGSRHDSTSIRRRSSSSSTDDMITRILSLSLDKSLLKFQRAAAALIDGFRNNTLTSLRELNLLGPASINDWFLRQIADALRHNTTLESIKISLVVSEFHYELRLIDQFTSVIRESNTTLKRVIIERGVPEINIVHYNTNHVNINNNNNNQQSNNSLQPQSPAQVLSYWCSLNRLGRQTSYKKCTETPQLWGLYVSKASQMSPSSLYTLLRDSLPYSFNYHPSSNV